VLSSELSTEFRGKIYEFQVQSLITKEILSFHIQACYELTQKKIPREIEPLQKVEGEKGDCLSKEK
jgi:hypothetical protein